MYHVYARSRTAQKNNLRIVRLSRSNNTCHYYFKNMKSLATLTGTTANIKTKSDVEKAIEKAQIRLNKICGNQFIIIITPDSFCNGIYKNLFN